MKHIDLKLKWLAGTGLIGLLLAGWLWAQPDSVEATLLDRSRTNLPPHAALSPGDDDARIAQLTAQLLARAHYLRQPFNNNVSSNFLDRLIKDLDPQHIHFLQSDLKGFERYRYDLDDLTVKYGDTTPAYEIFNRFLKRLEQRVRYSENLLQHEQFDFTGDERVVINRKDLPYPATLEEAEKLWRQRVRFEYLQEKLNQPVTKTATANAEPNSPTNTASSTVATATSTTTTNSTVRTPEESHAEIVKTLTRRYDRTLRMFRDWDKDDVLQFYLDTLAHVYDPHSDYMGKARAEDFAINMNLALFGIGALLQSEDGYCKIKELKPGPALKDGRIKNNDRIIAVAQSTNEPVDVVDMPLSKVVQLIRGPKGTEVRLTVIPADSTDSSKRKVVALIRDEIKLEDQEAKARIVETTNSNGSVKRIGVIDLPSFYAPMDNPATSDKSEPRYTSRDVAKLLKKLVQEKVGGVILDLRRNGGGSLDEAVKLTGLFIRRGPVVQVSDPMGIVMSDDDLDPDVVYDGPLVVLTSRFSASASEIVAGALQDYGRAIIVGDSSTYGKGTVQSLTQLRQFMRGANWETNDPGAIKVTIRKFYRPSGSSTQLKGVVPDIVLPSVNNLAEVGEANTECALAWDTIRAADFVPVNRIGESLEGLRSRSAKRIAEEPDFKYIREDMELYEKAQADKSVSLNEAFRLQEKQESDAREKARKKELAARLPKPEMVYEITLKQAELPGLPAPLAETNTVAALPNSHPTELAPEDGGDEDDIKAPKVDVALEESGRILEDYISLKSPGAVVAAGKPAATNLSVQE